MPDIVILLSRILMSAVFIVYGWMKFANVTGILNSEGTKRSWLWWPQALRRRLGLAI